MVFYCFAVVYRTFTEAQIQDMLHGKELLLDKNVLKILADTDTADCD